MKWIKLNGEYVEPENIQEIRNAVKNNQEPPEPVYKRKMNLYEEFCKMWASEALRVLKPGGHMLAFSGTRTYHRMATGVEDAGFEIRDKIDWMYGSGFPKNHDISKAIDKKNDVEREVVGTEEVDIGMQSGSMHANREQEIVEREKTVATSEQARQWEGFGTALKPAHEPIVVARKPLEEDTVAEQVMATGTGALNIDGTRIEYNSDSDKEKHQSEWDREQSEEQSERATYLNPEEDGRNIKDYQPDSGRYPANIILDIEAAQMLDEEVGESSSAASKEYHGEYGDDSMFMDGESHLGNQYTDTGGPSRFFYTAKASKSERTANNRIDNPHPTVKPVDLMQYLVRLVTSEGQKVCDPFLGSGTTLLACEEEDRIGYGSDMNKEYCDIATKRLGIRLGTELGSFMDY